MIEALTKLILAEYANKDKWREEDEWARRTAIQLATLMAPPYMAYDSNLIDHLERCADIYLRAAKFQKGVDLTAPPHPNSQSQTDIGTSNK